MQNSGLIFTILIQPQFFSLRYLFLGTEHNAQRFDTQILSAMNNSKITHSCHFRQLFAQHILCFASLHSPKVTQLE